MAVDDTHLRVSVEWQRIFVLHLQIYDEASKKKIVELKIGLSLLWLWLLEVYVC